MEVELKIINLKNKIKKSCHKRLLEIKYYCIIKLVSFYG